MNIHVDQLPECTIPINFNFQIQFVTFRRGHPGTPIHPAPVLLFGIHRSTSHALRATPWQALLYGSCLFAVASGCLSILNPYYSPAHIALRVKQNLLSSETRTSRRDSIQSCGSLPAELATDLLGSPPGKCASSPCQECRRRGLSGADSGNSSCQRTC